MPDIDTELTDKLVELFKIPQGDRDSGWMNEIFSVIPHAALSLGEKEVESGPDGFPYLQLMIPPEDGEFKGYSVAHLLDVCLEKGMGAVIRPDPAGNPLWVLSYGNLLSYKVLGSFDARDPKAAPPPPAPAGPRQIMVSQPSEAYLPKPAREIIRQYLQLNKVGAPAMFMLHDASMRPSEQLVFNLFRDAFDSDEHFNQVAYRLTWYLPPSYSFVTLPNDKSEFQKNFLPL